MPAAAANIVAFAVVAAALIIGVAVAVGPDLGGEEVPVGAVAVVGGDEITTQEFDAALLEISRRRGLRAAPTADDERSELLRQEALGVLLDAKWIEGEAAERGVEVSPEQVRERFEQIKGDRFSTGREYRAFLERSGLTEEQARQQVRLRLLSDLILREVPVQLPSVSSSQVEEIYEDDGERFQGQPRDAALRTIKQELEGRLSQELFAAFITGYRQKWVERTVCIEELANERCSNGEQSVAANCTEDQARRIGCPAPVSSGTPAAPGGSHLAPLAVRPQQPHPSGANPGRTGLLDGTSGLPEAPLSTAP